MLFFVCPPCKSTFSIFECSYLFTGPWCISSRSNKINQLLSKYSLLRRLSACFSTLFNFQGNRNVKICLKATYLKSLLQYWVFIHPIIVIIRYKTVVSLNTFTYDRFIPGSRKIFMAPILNYATQWYKLTHEFLYLQKMS